MPRAVPVRRQTPGLHLSLSQADPGTLLEPEKRDAHLRSFPVRKRRSGKLAHEFITKRAGKPKNSNRKWVYFSAQMILFPFSACSEWCPSHSKATVKPRRTTANETENRHWGLLSPPIKGNGSWSRTLFLFLEGEPEISLFGFRRFNGSEWNALGDIRPNVTLKPVTAHTA